MPITLKKTSSEYQYTHPYGFVVSAIYNPESGWEAHVTMSTHGARMETAAIDKLLESVQAFIRIAKEGNNGTG